MSKGHEASGSDAAISHEVRNSLAALRLLLEAVGDGVMEATPNSSVVNQMLLHVGLLCDLVDQRDALGPTRARQAIVRSVSLGAMAERWSEVMRPAAEARQVTLCAAITPGLPDVECRAGHIARVLVNLIENAIRHTPSGGVVTVSCVAHPGGVEVQVNDSGPGLPRAIRTGVLEVPRARRAGAAASTGLTLARSIIEAHGGVLWAASPAQGASVRFYLPTPSTADS